MLGVLRWVGSLRLQKQGFDHLMCYQGELISSVTKVPKQLFNGRTLEACLTPFHFPSKLLTNIPLRTLGSAQPVLLLPHSCEISSQVWLSSMKKKPHFLCKIISPHSIHSYA